MKNIISISILALSVLTGCSQTSESDYMDACEKHMIKSVTGDIAKQVCECSYSTFDTLSEESQLTIIDNMSTNHNNNLGSIEDTKKYIGKFMECTNEAVKNI